jgi:hypothetical protein
MLKTEASSTQTGIIIMRRKIEHRDPVQEVSGSTLSYECVELNEDVKSFKNLYMLCMNFQVFN